MDKEEIITLTGENGRKLDFRLEATVEYDDELYAIMVPVMKFQDMADDECLVFRMYEDEGGSSFELEYDEETINNVIEIYNNDLNA